MKKIDRAAILAATIALCAGTTQAQQPQVLTGDTRSACEAVLCLASGQRPSECTPPLQRYFSIVRKKASDTLRARSDFLSLCPSSNQTPQMQALVSAQVNGAGQCDAQTLNSSLRASTGGDPDIQYIRNQMPEYCTAYYGHAYTDFRGKQPAYVGLPSRGGYWVEPPEYNAALAQYNARVKAENEAIKNYVSQ